MKPAPSVQMHMTFRHYGPTYPNYAGDPIALNDVRQIPGVNGIVTALHHLPNGVAWPMEEILERKNLIEQNGLTWDVVESVPVHEDIRRGLPTRDKYIEAYQQTIRNLGQAGIPVICYNFMPLLDWTRTSLKHRRADGSYSLVYRDRDMDKIGTALPGWEEAITPDRIREAGERYGQLGHEGLWKNLEYFLNAIIPVAQEAGVKMAIHPDDPNFDLHIKLGDQMVTIPRIIVNEAAIKRFINIRTELANGITLCTGSYGILSSNNLSQMIRAAGVDAPGDRVHFVHMRNVRRYNEANGRADFDEVEHIDGDVDMFEVMNTLVEVGYTGAIRPDHGRDIWGEDGKPGYGRNDRALGAQYLLGLMEASLRLNKRETFQGRHFLRGRDPAHLAAVRARTEGTPEQKKVA